MNRNELIVSALAAGGADATYSPVQVQKLFFLIDREASQLVDGPHFNFRAYDYGPFDRAVYDELDALAGQGLVKTTSSGKYRTYSLTGAGFNQGGAELSKLPAAANSYVTEAAVWVQKLSFEQLVASIYKAFPEMKVNSVFRG